MLATSCASQVKSHASVTGAYFVHCLQLDVHEMRELCLRAAAVAAEVAWQWRQQPAQLPCACIPAAAAESALPITGEPSKLKTYEVKCKETLGQTRVMCTCVDCHV